MSTTTIGKLFKTISPGWGSSSTPIPSSLVRKLQSMYASVMASIWGLNPSTRDCVRSRRVR
jgi:hypothetical protein